MRFNILLFSCLCFLLSCGNLQQQRGALQDEQLSDTNLQDWHIRDTVIIYDIKDMSLEGAEAKVHYTENQIRFAEVSVYGETGQAKIEYLFLGNRIEVFEKIYLYKNGIDDVKSEEDMFLDESLRYVIDYDGNLIDGTGLDKKIDIYEEFKETVPFAL